MKLSLKPDRWTTAYSKALALVDERISVASKKYPNCGLFFSDGMWQIHGTPCYSEDALRVLKRCGEDVSELEKEMHGVNQLRESLAKQRQGIIDAVRVKLSDEEAEAIGI